MFMHSNDRLSQVIDDDDDDDDYDYDYDYDYDGDIILP